MTEKYKYHKERRKAESERHTGENVKKLLQIKCSRVALNVNCNNTENFKLETSGKVRLELVRRLELSNEFMEGIFAIRLANHHYLSSSVELECVRKCMNVEDNNAHIDNHNSNDIKENEQTKIITITTTLNVKPIDKECTLYNVEYNEREDTSDVTAYKTYHIAKETKESSSNQEVVSENIITEKPELTNLVICSDERIKSAKEDNARNVDSTECNVEDNELICGGNNNNTLELIFDFDEHEEEDENLRNSNKWEKPEEVFEETHVQTSNEEEEQKEDATNEEHNIPINSHYSYYVKKEVNEEVKNAQRRVLYLGFNNHINYDNTNEKTTNIENNNINNQNNENVEEKETCDIAGVNTFPSPELIKQYYEEEEKEEVPEWSESHVNHRSSSEEQNNTEHKRMTLIVEEDSVSHEQTTLYLCTVHFPPLTNEWNRHDDANTSKGIQDDKEVINNSTKTAVFVKAVIIEYLNNIPSAIDCEDREEFEREQKMRNNTVEELLIVAPNYTLLMTSREKAYFLCPLCYTLQQSTSITLQLSEELPTLVQSVESIDCDSNNNSALRLITLHSFPAEIHTMRLLFVLPSCTTFSNHNLLSHLPFTLNTSCRQNEQEILTELKMEQNKFPKSEEQEHQQQQEQQWECYNTGDNREYREIAQHCVVFDIVENNFRISYYYMRVDHVPYKLVLHEIIVDVIEYLHDAFRHLQKTEDNVNQEEECHSVNQKANCVVERANITAVNKSDANILLPQKEYYNVNTSTLSKEYQSLKAQEKVLTVVITEFSHRTLALRGGVDALSPHVLVISSSTLRSLCSENIKDVLRATCLLTRALVQNRLCVTCANLHCCSNEQENWLMLAHCVGDNLRVEQNAYKCKSMKDLNSDINSNVMYSAFSYALALEYMELRYVSQFMANNMYFAEQKVKGASSKNLCFNSTNNSSRNKFRKSISLLEWQKYLLQEGKLTSALLRLLSSLRLSTHWEEEEEEEKRSPLSPLTAAANKINMSTIECLYHSYYQQNTRFFTLLDKECRCKEWGMNLYIYFQHLRKTEREHHNYVINVSKEQSFVDKSCRQTSIIELLIALLPKIEECCPSDTFNRTAITENDNTAKSLLSRQSVTCNNTELPLSVTETVVVPPSLSNYHVIALRAMTANNVVKSTVSYTIYPFGKSVNELRHDCIQNSSGAIKPSNWKNIVNNTDVLFWKVALTCHFTHLMSPWVRWNFEKNNSKLFNCNRKSFHETYISVRKDNNVNTNAVNFSNIKNSNNNNNRSNDVEETTLHQTTFTLPVLLFVFAVYTPHDMRWESTLVNENKDSKIATHDVADLTICHSSRQIRGKEEKDKNFNVHHNNNVEQNIADNSERSTCSKFNSRLEMEQKALPHVKLVQASSLRWREPCRSDLKDNNIASTMSQTKRVEFVIYNEWAERQRAEKNKNASMEINRNRQSHTNRKRRRRDTSTELFEKKLRKEIRHGANEDTTLTRSLAEGLVDNKKYKNECTEITNNKETFHETWGNGKHVRDDKNKSNSNNSSKYRHINSSVSQQQLKPMLVPFVCIDKTALPPLSSVSTNFYYDNNNNKESREEQCLTSQLFAFLELKSTDINNCEAESTVLCALISHLIGFTTFHAAYPERVRHAQESVWSHHKYDLDYDNAKLTLLSDSVIVAYSTLLNSLLLKFLDVITAYQSNDGNYFSSSGSRNYNNDIDSNNNTNNKNTKTKNVISLSENDNMCKVRRHAFLLQMINTVTSAEFVIRAVIEAANYYRKKTITNSKSNNSVHDNEKKDKHTHKTKTMRQHSRKKHSKSEVRQHSYHSALPMAKEKWQEQVEQPEEQKRKILEEHNLEVKNRKHHISTGQGSTDETLLLDSHVLLHAFWYTVLEEKVLHKLLESLTRSEREVSPYHLVTHLMRPTREELQMQHIIHIVERLERERCHLQCIKRENSNSRNNTKVKTSKNINTKLEMSSERKLSLRTPTNATISRMHNVLQNCKEEHKWENEKQITYVTRERQTWPSIQSQVDALTTKCEELLKNAYALSILESDDCTWTNKVIESLWFALQLYRQSNEPSVH